MFVLMMHGYPISAKLPEDPGFGERFWYWRGQSGRTYIHSIYDKTACPPLCDAVVVLVQVRSGMRVALSVERLGTGPENDRSLSVMAGWHDADEVHVHLLAREANAAAAVEQDLANALGGNGQIAEPNSEVLERSQLALAFC